MEFLVRHSAASGFNLDLRPGVPDLHGFDLGAGGTLQLLGDPVLDGRERWEQVINAQGSIDINALYNTARGHYYWFHHRADTLTFGSSFGAIPPIYHHRDQGVFEAGPSQFALARRIGRPERDPRYLLERLLFNYPLFDRTPWTGIRRLDAHTSLRLDATGVRQEKGISITDHFGDGRLHSRRDLDDLCSLFAEECERHLPKEPFGISLTGGLDGRTLLAAALQADRRDLFTYSFGVPGEEDVTLPQALAAKLGVEHVSILLDGDYVEHHSLDSALGFMALSEYNGNLGRPHYHHAARLLARRTRHIITGNFGSELFRALHQPGVMMTEHLIAIFASKDASWKDHIRSAAPLGSGPEVDSLIEDISAWLANDRGLSPNQRLYRFVLEEMFRKYFGPELVMQAHFLKNRTPFLTLPFFRAVNATRWSGVHADLFERNKLRRMKGQVFYAAFLRASDPVLYRALTSKGYSPADVFEKWRSPLLMGRAAVHRYIRNEQQDSNAVMAFFQRYRSDLSAHGVPTGPHFGNGTTEELSEAAIHRASLAIAWNAAGDPRSAPSA